MSSSASESEGYRIALISLHGLIRANDPELGRDADTGGQVKYVLELAAELQKQPKVAGVELITRQIIDDRIDPSYSQIEEPIEGNAKLVRLPFGPKRYLRKEALWPYIDIFVDQAIAHFRRVGIPDLIHGHYADAGLAGAQLARLLGVPYVFTGHSLGRVKKQRLMKREEDSASASDLEQNYKFTVRVEAEEVALETASLVVASTSQEVEQQYELYHHYVPERMEVIPPGVNLESFRPPRPDDGDPPIAEKIHPFLQDPAKPMVLAMARPDERKNLASLVRVFGNNQELRDKANLVLVMGTRDDVRELPPSQRRELMKILTLIDVYDLYGKVAYPKHHVPLDVPDLYRLAAANGGVFVNPALTEPFGLTLLEAAASGLPIVATNDGGPRDIIANCQNGLLIDPFDDESIEHALLRVLTEPEQWQEWSEHGIAGATEYYSWATHAKRYMRDAGEILARSTAPILTSERKPRRLPDFDRLIITDLDNTLTGDDEGLQQFVDMLRSEASHVGFGIATGRSLEDAQQLVAELGLPMPDLFATSVGTELHYGDALTPDVKWRKQIAFQWKPQEIRELLGSLDGLFLQDETQQTEFKISYGIDTSIAPKVTVIKRQLREAGLRVKLIFSLGQYLDVIPVRAGSEMSIRHLAYRWGFPPEQMLVAGDSGNDEGMLKGRTLGVVVANHSAELEKLRKLPRIYFAEQAHARGILEGIDYYQFLSHITIPNDWID